MQITGHDEGWAGLWGFLFVCLGFFIESLYSLKFTTTAILLMPGILLQSVELLTIEKNIFRIGERINLIHQVQLIVKINTFSDGGFR